MVIISKTATLAAKTPVQAVPCALRLMAQSSGKRRGRRMAFAAYLSPTNNNRQMRKTILTTTTLLFSALTSFAQGVPLRIWDNRPGSFFENSMPIGNGKLGAMVDGNPHCDYLKLTTSHCGAANPSTQTKMQAHTSGFRRYAKPCLKRITHWPTRCNCACKGIIRLGISRSPPCASAM